MTQKIKLLKVVVLDNGESTQDLGKYRFVLTDGCPLLLTFAFNRQMKFLRLTRHFLVCISLLMGPLAYGQDEPTNAIAPAQLGFAGLIYTPSAYQNSWKTIDVGFTHFSKGTSFTYRSGVESERAFIADIVLLPRISFSIKLTRPYENLRPDAQPGSGRPSYWGIGDRSYSFRAQVLKEKKYQPALLIGVQDPNANLAFFNTNYVVVSKSLEKQKFQYSASLGYGVSIEETAGDYLQGTFGGVVITWNNALTAMAEYDTQTFNVGLGYQFKN
ncbi:MAG: YjbH domain-containing protein, partial [Bacteroidota bacterium]